jgi:hypothetical protein
VSPPEAAIRRRATFVAGVFALSCGVFVAGYRIGEFDTRTAPADDFGALLFSLVVAAAPLVFVGIVFLKRFFSRDAKRTMSQREARTNRGESASACLSP